MGPGNEEWRVRLRRPERFTLVSLSATVSGTVQHVRREDDHDVHLQLRLDDQRDEYLNHRNREAQNGCLVVEIEPWQHGYQSTAMGCDVMNCRQPETWAAVVPHIKAGVRLTVTGPVVDDMEPGHGWREIHSPTEVIAHVETQEGG